MPCREVGWILFLLTAVCSTALTRLRQSPSRTQGPSIRAEYTDTLRKLFTPSHGGSRHMLGSLSTSEIFTMRSSFFSSLFTSHGLSKTKVIHVAGTKGKGSTVECIAQGLMAAGHTVGVFTSPHLHTARERIKLNNELISPEDMVRYGKLAFERMESCPWAVFFDYFLCMAILFFADHNRLSTSSTPLDYLILETGVGGRFDSTNFIERPLASVITSISLDHQAVLGNTIEEIAWQKAGIIKANCPVFTAETQCPEVMQVFQIEADKIGAPLHVVEVDK